MTGGDGFEGRPQVPEGLDAIDLRDCDQGGDAGPGAAALVVSGEERNFPRSGRRG